MPTFLRILVLLVFLSGFSFLGGFFFGRSRQSEPVSSAQVSVVSVETEDDDLSEEERRMAEALNDPDFRRVHDHLMRDKPIQMNVPVLSNPATEKPGIPMSERPPVRFDLNVTGETTD